jgi:peptide/nickel transport system permease protein
MVEREYTPIAEQEEKLPKKPSQLKEIWRMFKKNRLAMVSLIILILLVLLTGFAEQIGTYQEAITMNVKAKLQNPSREHIFGTDQFGRDLFLRCIHGGRVSLFIAFVSTFLIMIFGCIIGIITAYYGGQFDNIIMRIFDSFSAIPTILFALTLVAALGQGISNLIVALVISRIPAFVRIVRASTLSIIDQEYIEAARSGGTSDVHIMLRHVLPNVVGPLIVQATMNVSSMILQTASLSFLGLGISAPQPEWGALISEAKEFMRVKPFMIIFPGVFIILASASINLIGDGLRDALDPRLRS